MKFLNNLMSGIGGAFGSFVSGGINSFTGGLSSLFGMGGGRGAGNTLTDPASAETQMQQNLALEQKMDMLQQKYGALGAIERGTHNAIEELLQSIK